MEKDDEKKKNIIDKEVVVKINDIAEFCFEVASFFTSEKFGSKYDVMIGLIGCRILSEGIAKQMGFDKESYVSFMKESESMREEFLDSYEVIMAKKTKDTTGHFVNSFDYDDEENEENDEEYYIEEVETPFKKRMPNKLIN